MINMGYKLLIVKLILVEINLGWEKTAFLQIGWEMILFSTKGFVTILSVFKTNGCPIAPGN